jgi:hypothetical protein
MVSVHQIRLRLADWINGEISLAEFEDWFVPETWDIHKLGDKEAEDLVDEIELNLSEYSGGYLSKEELQASLKRLVSPIIVINWNRPDAIPVSGQSLRVKSGSWSSLSLLVARL